MLSLLIVLSFRLLRSKCLVESVSQICVPENFHKVFSCSLSACVKYLIVKVILFGEKKGRKKVSE